MNRIINNIALVSDKSSNKLKIGDPMYFTSRNPRALELTIDTTLEKCDVCKIVLSEMEGYFISEYTGRRIDYKETLVRIVFAKNESDADLFVEGGVYAKEEQEIRDLGCDTASFIIETDYGDKTFYTCCDGMYGIATIMENSHGLVVDLTFNEHFEFATLVEDMCMLFNARKVD